MQVQPVAAPQPVQQPQMVAQPVAAPQPIPALYGAGIPMFAFGGFTGNGSDLNTKGWADSYATRDAKYNTGNDTADRWAWLAAGRPAGGAKPAQQQRPPQQTPQLPQGPGASATTNPLIHPPVQFREGGPNFVGSGGNRLIDNSVGGAKFGFDKNAPIDIAAHGGTRNVVNNPGVSMLQSWKFAPRTLQNLGASGRQMLQSQWNATGAAPDDLYGRGANAQPSRGVLNGSYS
jgi:hypothetical protein